MRLVLVATIVSSFAAHGVSSESIRIQGSVDVFDRVGAALVREGLERCADLGWRAVFVLGDPAYYSRFGFVLAAPLGFRYESQAFDSAFQLFELVPGCLARRAGRVHYDEAFTRL